MEKICIYQFGVTYGIEEANNNTIDKLNTMTDTINEMARNYKDNSYSEEKEIDNKRDFIENLIEKLDDMKENVLYDDLIEEDNGLSLEIFDLLEKKSEITKDDIIKTLENRNEYILGFEDFDTNMKIEDDINKVTRLINDTYKIGQVNRIWKKRIKENKKVISSQLRWGIKSYFRCCRSYKQNK